MSSTCEGNKVDGDIFVEHGCVAYLPKFFSFGIRHLLYRSTDRAYVGRSVEI